MTPSPSRQSWATWLIAMSRQPAPISVHPSAWVARWTVTYSRTAVSAPIVTSGPMIENAPIRTPAARFAFASTTQVEWMPSDSVIHGSRRTGLRRGDSETAFQLLKTALRGAKTAGHVRQVLLRREEPLGLEHRHRRRAQPPLARRNVLRDAGLSAQHGSVADRQVVREADLPGRDDAAAEPARARDAHLGHDDR